MSITVSACFVYISLYVEEYATRADGLLTTAGGITVYSTKKKQYAYTSLKMLEKCMKLIFLHFDLIVLAKYKGT